MSEAMKAAVNLEIKNALGLVTTRAIADAIETAIVHDKKYSDMLAALRRASSFILCNGYDAQDQALLNEISSAIAQAEGRRLMPKDGTP